MTTYAVVYKAYCPTGPGRTNFANAFIAAACGAAYYDGGDDPALFSAQGREGPVTWGVCRPTLRRRLAPGDTVVFFARKETIVGLDYFLIGFATVETKVSQEDIWRRDNLAQFRHYLNLLIRPKRGSKTKCRHYEPVDCHRDWLWRICQPMGHTKEEFNKASPNGIFWPGRTRLQGCCQPVSCGANYVIFSRDPSETAILCEPLHVASAPPLKAVEVETWFGDTRSQALGRLVIGQSSAAENGRRGLKTTNPQQAHPHLVIDGVGDVTQWRREMRALMEGP